MGTATRRPSARDEQLFRHKFLFTARGPGAKPLHGYRWFEAYAIDHARTALTSLGRLYRAPFSSLLTMAVIGIALALPGGLYVLLDNVQALAGGWNHAGRISLFLQPGSSEDVLWITAAKLRARADIAAVKTVTAAEALREFRGKSGFGRALDALDYNPLPHVVIVTPAPEHQHTARMRALADKLQRWRQIDRAQLDMQWLQRFYALMGATQRGVSVIAGMLGVAVLLVIGNTIRLDIQNRRDEIEIIKLVGATDAFVRRPFLYLGIWYGLFGGLLAWLMVYGALAIVAGPAERLIGLYRSEHTITAFSAADSLSLLALSTGLGLAGAWLAVSRHLSAIEPG